MEFGLYLAHARQVEKTPLGILDRLAALLLRTKKEKAKVKTVVFRDADLAVGEIVGDEVDVTSFVAVKNVGRALAVIRVKKRISQKELAEALSAALAEAGKDGVEIGGILLKGGTNEAVSQSYISKVEKGRKNVSLSRLALFCYFLDCSLSEVFSTAELLTSQAKMPEAELNLAVEAMANDIINAKR